MCVCYVSECIKIVCVIVFASMYVGVCVCVRCVCVRALCVCARKVLEQVYML